MEEEPNLLESLIDKAADYGKTSLDLVKLKAVDRTSTVGSSLILHTIVFILFTSFLLFVNLGIAFWVGDILGSTYWGFLIVAGFYCLVCIVMLFVMPGWFKRIFGNYIVRQLLK